MQRARWNNTAIDLKTHSRAVRERENEEKIKFDWIVKVESFHQLGAVIRADKERRRDHGGRIIVTLKRLSIGLY